jgi:hypothetical protein
MRHILFVLVIALLAFTVCAEAQTTKSVVNHKAYTNSQLDTVSWGFYSGGYLRIGVYFTSDTVSADLLIDTKPSGSAATHWVNADSIYVLMATGKKYYDRIIRDNYTEKVAAMNSDVRSRIQFRASGNAVTKYYSYVLYVR